VVAWVADDGSVRAAVRPPGGFFAGSTLLAPSGGGAPAITLDGTGHALLAWTEHGTVSLARYAPGDAGFTEIPTGIAGAEGDLDVAFVGADSAIVTWLGGGAIRAIMSTASGYITAVPNLSTGPGASGPHLAAASSLAVAAWTHIAVVPGNPTDIRVQASVRPFGGAFAPPEDVASGSVLDGPGSTRTGNWPTADRVVVSGDGSADLLVDNLLFQGQQGDTAVEGLVAVRPRGAGWTSPVRLGFADAPAQGGALAQWIAGSDDGEALYVAGQKSPGSPTMTFSARSRASGSASYGEPATLLTGAPGEVRAAALSPHRFVVLMRSADVLMSRAGDTSGFDPVLRFTDTDSTGLIAIDGAPTGLAVAAWTTANGRVDVATYEDQPGALPPTAGRDTTAPVLRHLSMSPRRFAVRRSAGAATARGTRIRWQLSEPARVVLRVDRARGGFRHGSRCEAKKPRTGRARHCTRFVRVGSFRRTAAAGRDSVRFAGFVHGHVLARGSYRLTAIATDGARNTSKAKRARFAIVRR
jgi:hypothetical protein